MPQDKFITRENAKLQEAPIKRAKALETWTDRGWKAGQKAYDKTIGNAKSEFLRNTASDRDAFAENRINELELKNRTAGPARRLERAEIRADIAERNAMKLTDNKIVAKRDATNARIARERLVARKNAASQSTKAVAGSALASGLAKGLGVAGVMIASQKAAGATPEQERALMQSAMNDPKSWYNTKGPGSVGRSYYNGQSPMSKMMGVGKKSK